MRSPLKVLIGILLFISCSLLSQNAQNTGLQKRAQDSLENIISGSADLHKQIDALNELAYLFVNSDSAKTAAYLNKALSLSAQADYPKGKARSLTLLGHLCLYNGRQDKSIANYLDALKLSESVKDSDGIANEMNSIGNVYYMEQNYKKALEYFKGTAEIYRREKDTADYAGILNNIGAGLFALGKKDSALSDYTEAIRLAEFVNDNPTILNALNNIGNVYTSSKDYPRAIEFLARSISISEKIGDKRGIALATENLANNYGIMGENPKCIEYGTQALNIATSIKAEDLERDICNLLASAYAATGKYDSAYKFQQRYSSLSEQLLNEDKSRQIGEAEAKYKNEKKQKEIDVLNQKDKDNGIIIYSVSFAGLIILFLAILLLNRYRVNKKTAGILAGQKNVIEDTNRELERLSLVAKATENVVIIMDAKGKIEWANESFSRLNGISIEELKKKKGETIYEISNNPDIGEIISRATREKKSVVYESLNLNKDGERIWESTTLTPVFNTRGELYKLIIVDNDVTRRKNDEEIIRQKNKDITDSISYAKYIQTAILPSPGEIENAFTDSFVLFKPKDIVSGDFYWMTKKGDFVFIAAADCTGHGVPGGFMSMLGNSLLNEVVVEKNITDPAEILDLLRVKIILALKQKGQAGESRDGMDMVLCRFDVVKNKLAFAAANNPLWLIRDSKLQEFKPDKQPVGFSGPAQTQFTQHEIQLEKNDTVYFFTDGYADQFGGPLGKKFKYKPLQNLLLSNSGSPMKDQALILEKTFEDWKRDLEQVDDVLVIGIKIL